MLQSETDIDKVYRVLIHPSVIETITDDAGIPKGLYDYLKDLLNTPSVYFLMPDNDTCLVYNRRNFITYEVHTNIVAGPSRKKSIHNCFKSLYWMFSNTECKKVISEIPSFNRAALFLALKCGLKKEGLLHSSFQKNNTLYDTTVVGITKEEFLCRLSPQLLG